MWVPAAGDRVITWTYRWVDGKWEPRRWLDRRYPPLSGMVTKRGKRLWKRPQGPITLLCHLMNESFRGLFLSSILRPLPKFSGGETIQFFTYQLGEKSE